MNKKPSLLVRLLVLTGAVIVSEFLLPGVHVETVLSAIGVTLILSLLNVTVKPILIAFTLFATVLTMGLFLLVIKRGGNLAGRCPFAGFSVDSFWWALAFSLVLSLTNSLLRSATGTKND